MANSKKPKRKVLFYTRPKEGQKVEEISSGIANAVIKLINDWRATQGLPPLPKE